MSDLVAFLRARLDEDEAAAHAAWPATWRPTERAVGVESAELGPMDSYREAGLHMTVANLASTVGKVQIEQRNAEHIARWDPARVLAEVAAKRAILDAFELAGSSPGPDWGLAWALIRDEILKPWAYVHAERPDFDPAWRTA